VVFTASSSTVGLTATVPFKHDGRDVTAEFKLAEGESAMFAMDEADSDMVPRACSGEEAEELLAATVAFWRNWLSASRYRGRWREVVHRSALTLKLLTYAPTGAIVAAPTTGCPNRSAGSATGTTGMSGSATRPSAYTRCCGSVSPARPMLSSTS
jgi:hypothetical protein